MAIFKPYKITSSQLETVPITEGQFIVTTDTNKIYLDESASNRIELIPVPTKTSDLVNDMNFMSGMTILSYGHSTWNDFITAYTAKHVVYTRASSGSNPGSGSQTRLAFMAYVNNADNPTEVEFQYYRSISSHSDSQQGDQTYVYKLNKTNGWSVTVRENYTKVVAGTGMSSTWSGGKITLNCTVTPVTKTSDLTNDSGFITNSADDLVNYTKSSDLATVATSGDYDDLLDTPDLSGYITKDVNDLTYYTPTNNLATVATSGDYTDLINTPTIPTVNNAVLTIQKNGTDVTSFTANASTDVTANITVPTKVSDLTNDSGFTSNTGTVTSVGTGAGLTGGSITTSGTIKANLKSETKSTLASENMGSTTNRQYAVGIDKDDKLSVNIPWTDNNTTYSLTQDSSDGHKITLTPSSGSAQTITIPDNNTTYTFATGDNNGEIKVTPSGGNAQGVAVQGLNNAAYKDVDSSISAASTSTKLPTSQAVASFVEGKGYTTNTGTVTKVTAGTGLTGGDITTTGTIALGTSGVTAGTYQGLTVDKYGRVTAASDQGYTSNTGTITGVSVNSTSIATSGVANITSIPASILTGVIPSAVTATTQSQGDNSTKIATTAYVDTAIDNLPDPMVFKGSLGTGGTITALPVDGSAKVGDTYKVITDGTYASKAAKVGDTFICLTQTSSTNTWELIPSGDEPSGTVTSITIKATSPIAIDSNSAITTSGTRTLSHANSGVTAGTYKSVTVNATGHVTAGTNPTTLSGYGITDAKINSGVITLGSNTITPLTSSSTLDATKLSGTIPSECYTDTTYSAGTGLALDGTTINHSNSVTAATAGTSSATSGSTLAVPYVTYDAQGHITASGTHTHTISGFATTDTKNTAGTTNTTDKIYLAGGKSQGDNPQTYSNVNCYASGGKLYSNAKEVVNLSDTQALTNKTYNGYTLAAASAKAVDTSISAASTSANLPTSAAVATFVEGKGYVLKSGDTMTGDLTINKATPMLYIKTNDTTTDAIIKFGNSAYNANGIVASYGGANGYNLTIGGGGRTIVGSGEAASNLASTLGKNQDAETLYFISDQQIWFDSNAQTTANRVGFQLTNSGQIAPTVADALTNNSGAIGTPSYNWANIYATNYNFGNTVATMTYNSTDKCIEFNFS